MKQKTANFPITFPVTLTAQWHTPESQNLSLLSTTLTDWLLDEGSLTARLKSCGKDFQVKVIGEQQQLCSSAEACSLIKAGEPVLVREVLLYCDNVPQVFARSLLPLSSLTGNEQVLANLGDQSLGQVLFNNPSLQRQHLELSSFASDSSVTKLANTLMQDALTLKPPAMSAQSLWGRRSIFVLENKPLMVAEVFLPNAFAYLECEKPNKS